MRAVVAAVVVVAATAAGVAHTLQRPAIRKSVWEPQRLDWDAHVHDLEERGCFSRMYRMPRPTFEKLAYLLSPKLTVNRHFAGEYRYQREAGDRGCMVSGTWPTCLAVYLT